MPALDDPALLLHLVDLVLAVSLAELGWRLLRPRAACWLPNLLAGLALIAALRLALGGAGLPWVAPCLAAAGVAHLLDVRARQRHTHPPATPALERPLP